MPKIDEYLLDLAQQRKTLSESVASMKQMLEIVQSDPRYQDLELKAMEAKEAIKAIEAKIDTLGKTHFVSKDGDKHPHRHVTVKVFKVATIKNPTVARSWLWKKLPDALTVDMKMVQEYAVNVGKIEGVEVIDDPRVQIDRDLTDLLGGQNE